jgi:hypothetical protein
MSMVTRTQESSGEPTKADAEEPEITEEMILAGERILCRYDPEDFNEDEVLRRIYIAMHSLRERGVSPR